MSRKTNGLISISYSELSTYLNCPHQWKLNYDSPDLEVPFQDNIYLANGTALHHGIQMLYSYSLKAAQDGFLELFQKRCDELKIDQPTREKYISSGYKILEDYQKSEYMNYTLVEVEHSLFEPIIANHIYFKGFVDLWLLDKNKDHILLDLKTTSKGWGPKDRKNPTKHLQLLLYKYFLRSKTGEDAELRFVLLNGAKQKIETVKIDASKERVDKAFKVLFEVINNMYCLDKAKYKNLGACFFCQWKDTSHCNQSNARKDFVDITQLLKSLN